MQIRLPQISSGAAGSSAGALPALAGCTGPAACCAAPVASLEVTAAAAPAASASFAAFAFLLRGPAGCANRAHQVRIYLQEALPDCEWEAHKLACRTIALW